MTTDLPAVLARLEDWLAEHVPAIHATLRPGAPDAELDALEAHTGLKLPEAFRVLYRWHDGQEWGAGDVFGLEFLPLVRVQREWDVWRSLEAEFQETKGHSSHPSGAIKTQYINLGWIPFLADGGGNSVGVDLNPGPSGRPGQVVTFGRDENHKYVLARGLDSFLAEYVARLEAERATVEVSEDFPEIRHISLHDAQGEPVDEYTVLADLYPGFGAAPTRRSR